MLPLTPLLQLRLDLHLLRMLLLLLLLLPRRLLAAHLSRRSSRLLLHPLALLPLLQQLLRLPRDRPLVSAQHLCLHHLRLHHLRLPAHLRLYPGMRPIAMLHRPALPMPSQLRWHQR